MKKLDKVLSAIGIFSLFIGAAMMDSQDITLAVELVCIGLILTSIEGFKNA